MKTSNPAMSKLFELRPDPYDNSQRKFVRICLFMDVENTQDLKEFVNNMDIAIIRAELVLEPFVLLAAANKAISAAAHNRMVTRSLSAELIYSLSPQRNIATALETFGALAKEPPRNIILVSFDDAKGKKMLTITKRIKGIPMPLEKLGDIADEQTIKQIYQLPDPELNDGNRQSDMCVARIVAKDLI